MSFFTDIKHKLFLRKLAEKRRRVAAAPEVKHRVNPGNASHIALLFPADSAEDRKIIDRWRDRNKRIGAKIEVLGYFTGEVGTASFDFSVVTARARNWYGVPRGQEVEDFLRTSCELLIRLGKQEHPELDYLAALKSAVLKVGPQSVALANPYHLRFETNDADDLAGQLAAIEQIFTYTNAAATS